MLHQVEPICAKIAYAERTAFRPRYFANDHSRDTVVVEPREMAILNGRMEPPSLEREGFELVPHLSGVSDFEDSRDVAARYPDEIVEMLRALTGADEVRVTAPGILRFSEVSNKAGALDNSMPARFAHIDATGETSARFATQSLPEGREFRRYAHYNVWRAFSAPPQDVPLALCDARSVAASDLIVADAIFDPLGLSEWSFESWIVAHNSAHRWVWFPDMTRDEVVVFRTSDSLLGTPVPHVAFDDPHVAAAAPPRASIEMRAVAYWYR
jgi:hypothetical protein